VNLSVKRTSEQDAVFRKSVHQGTTCFMVWIHVNIKDFMNIRQYSFKLKSSSMWSLTAECCAPSSTDCYGTDFAGHNQPRQAETAAHVVKHIFLQLHCRQSLTLTRANTHFSLPSNVAFYGGALLNRSENTVMTLTTVWPGCGLTHTHVTCY
jgi:hypothetical protein